MTPSKILDKNDILLVILPSNTTDPIDGLVTIKEILKNDWYIFSQSLKGKDVNELESDPIDPSIATMKHVGAQWLVEAFDHIQNNPFMGLYRSIYCRDDLYRTLLLHIISL